MHRIIAILLLLFAGLSAAAQQASLKGTILDTLEKKPLSLAVVSLLHKKDSTLFSFTRSGRQGDFNLGGVAPGKYVLPVTYPWFAEYAHEPEVKEGKAIDLGQISLILKALLLQEVGIHSGQAIRLKSNTPEFTAGSFAVKEGATVEDLLKKLSGLSVNSKGEITAQGKSVDRVLVDGEEFFGSDPTMATKNLSAKAVDKVQVYDTKTERQQLSGITTGNEGKTVNIKLKEAAKKGAFGKLAAGTDAQNYMESKEAAQPLYRQQKDIGIRHPEQREHGQPQLGRPPQAGHRKQL